MNTDIDNDTADTGVEQDQEFDTLGDAVEALGDDEQPDNEQTETDEGDLDPDEAQASDGEDETESDEDLEEGDSVLVTLDGGEQVDLGELKKGYFRDKDYRSKTEALADERKSVEAVREQYGQNANVLQTAYQNLTQLMEGLIPAEPDLSLAQTDPGEYQFQVAVRNNAIGELQKVYAGRQELEGTVQGASEADISRHKSEEEAKLLSALPILKDPGRKAAFDTSVQKTALEFGFSEQEISSTADHRILQLVHFARIGKIAEQNRKNAGRRVAEKPREGVRANPVAGKPSKSRGAMKRLAQSGSLEDAMAVDFD